MVAARYANGYSKADERRRDFDYDVTGAGPTVVLVPGSCSTGAAWRLVIAAWDKQFRCVTTSLLGYGGTAERRSVNDPSIMHEAAMLEEVIREAGGRVHLVGHSFGGSVALAVVLRNRVPLASLSILEAPAVSLLWAMGEQQHYLAFRRMTDSYFAAFNDGNAAAIATMIDFYGGPGTLASWSPRVRAYAVATTAVNIRDWQSAYEFPLSPSSLKHIQIPTLVVHGTQSPPGIRRANVLLREHVSRASLSSIAGAAHFMISTHAQEVSRIIGEHVRSAEADLNSATVENRAFLP
jgi:pimeloyl-ACP methyl ester carboxylesterase